jgi:hypothetical protein
MRKRALLAFLILTGASSSQASDGISWHWDKDSPACALFQHTPDGKTIFLVRVPGEDESRISFNVRSPNFWKGYYEGGSVTLSTGVIVPATIQVYSGENRQYDLTATVRGASFTSALASSSSVTVSHSDFGKFTVSLRDVAPAMTALRSCENGRLTDWGIDVGAYWALASRPRPVGQLAALFDSNVYPGLAAFRNVERNIIARTQVAPDGNVLSCSVPGNFGYPEFVDAVCDVLKKGAHFEPAHDKNGKAVAAPYVVLVSFRMER